MNDLSTVGNEDPRPLDVESYKSALNAMPDDELRGEVVRLLKVGAQCLVALAMCVSVAHDRGVDLDGIPPRLLDYLLKVAHGQVLGDVLAKLNGQPALMHRVAALPLPGQRRVLDMLDDDEPVKLMVLDDAGSTHRMVPLFQLAASEIAQVFAPGHIRDETDQLRWLQSRAAQKRRAATGATPGVVFDKRRRRILVTGDQFPITARQLLEYAASITD